MALSGLPPGVRLNTAASRRTGPGDTGGQRRQPPVPNFGGRPVPPMARVPGTMPPMGGGVGRMGGGVGPMGGNRTPRPMPPQAAPGNPTQMMAEGGKSTKRSGAMSYMSKVKSKKSGNNAGAGTMLPNTNSMSGKPKNFMAEGGATKDNSATKKLLPKGAGQYLSQGGAAKSPTMLNNTNSRKMVGGKKVVAPPGKNNSPPARVPGTTMLASENSKSKVPGKGALQFASQGGRAKKGC